MEIEDDDNDILEDHKMDIEYNDYYTNNPTLYYI